MGKIVNPHAAPKNSPVALWGILRQYRNLIVNLTIREVSGRYRGSVLGLLWSFFHPLLMLAVYTFVFSVVFKARWNVGSESKTEFAMVLFVGLMVFNLLAECLNRAPTLVLANANYVKKVVFPIEILPVVNLLSAAFHMLISLIVWLIFFISLFGAPPATLLLLPLVLLPLVMLALGCSWILASLGVYLRDVAQVITALTMALMFLSPIFYSVSSLPKAYWPIIRANPLTQIIEQTRDVMIFGRVPSWEDWLIHFSICSFVAWFGFYWFQRTRKGFSDVL